MFWLVFGKIEGSFTILLTMFKLLEKLGKKKKTTFELVFSIFISCCLENILNASNTRKE